MDDAALAAFFTRHGEENKAAGSVLDLRNWCGLLGGAAGELGEEDRLEFARRLSLALDIVVEHTRLPMKSAGLHALRDLLDQRPT